MRNIIIILIETIICYSSMILLYKKYKTDGLYTYGIIASFLSSILTLKQIDIMSIGIPTGLALTTSIIIAGNIITQKRGKEEIKEYLILIILTIFFSSLFLNISGIIESSKYNELANNSYNNIFKYNLKPYLALTLSLGLSIYCSNKLYYLLKRLQNKIYISNIFSIIIIELLENTIFVLTLYLFNYTVINIILCIIFRYLIKAIIGIIGTIPIYICNKIN